MLFALAYLGNAAANFVFGLAISALLGPAEFGRYATATLAASVVATLAFDWLRLSTNRFWLALDSPKRASASLEAGFYGVAAVLALLAGLAYVVGVDFGLGGRLVALSLLLAIANARFDYRGARLRALEQPAGFLRLSLARQGLLFTAVLLTAYWTHDALAAAAAMALTQALAAMSLGGLDRATPRGARFDDIQRFARYSAPIVAATVLFLSIGLVNREIALARFGAAETGKLALATDLSSRLFMAFNFIPETLLFQIVMRREADEGAAAAHNQLRLNQVYAIAVIAPIGMGYMTMAPTFEALIVPHAFRGEFATLARDLAPGFLAYCGVYAICNPLFQLARRTWPAVISALIAFAVDLGLAGSPQISSNISDLALAHTISLIVGFAAAALLAMRETRITPRWRDLSAVAISTAAMSLAIRPLNAIPSAPLAAGLALLAGGAVFGAALIAFDVAGARQRLVERLREGAFAGLKTRL